MRLPSIILLCLLLAAGPVLSQDSPGEAEAGWVEAGEIIEDGSNVPLPDTEAAQLYTDFSYEPARFPAELQRFAQGQPAASADQDSMAMLRDILQSEAFQQDIQPDVQDPTVMQRVSQWINRTLGSIAQSLGLGPGGNNLLVYVLIVLALALMAVIIRQLVMHTGPGRSRRSTSPDDEDDPDVDLARLAEQFASRGDYRKALRYRFLAVLRSMDLPATTMTTNSMLVRQVSIVHPALFAEFRQLVDIFEDAWYGSLECDNGQYRAAAQLAGSLDSRIRLAAGEGG